MKDWKLFALVALVSLVVWTTEVDRHERQDRELIIQLKDNQKIEADILKLQAAKETPK